MMNKEWVIEQLIDNMFVAKAQEKPDIVGANRALHLLGLEMGMYVERKEIGQPGAFDGLTIASKRERLLGIARQLGLGHISEDGRHRFGEGVTAESACFTVTNGASDMAGFSVRIPGTAGIIEAKRALMAQAVPHQFNIVTALPAAGPDLLVPTDDCAHTAKAQGTVRLFNLTV